MFKLFKKKDNDIYKRFCSIWHSLDAYDGIKTDRVSKVESGKYQIETEQGQRFITFCWHDFDDYLRASYGTYAISLFGLDIHSKDDSKFDLGTYNNLSAKEVFDAIHEIETILHDDKVNLDKAKDDKEKQRQQLINALKLLK